MYMLCAHWAITYGQTMAQAVQTMRRLRGVSPLGFPQGKVRTDAFRAEVVRVSLARRCSSDKDKDDEEEEQGMPPDQSGDDDEDEQETRPGIEQEDEGKGQKMPTPDMPAPNRVHEELAALGKMVTVLQRFDPDECESMLQWLSLHFVKDIS